MNHQHILSTDDLKMLTGAKMPTRIRRCLTKNKISFLVRVDGWPATTWDAVHHAMGLTSPEIKAIDEPNLDFLRLK